MTPALAIHARPPDVLALHRRIATNAQPCEAELRAIRDCREQGHRRVDCSERSYGVRIVSGGARGHRSRWGGDS